MPRNPRANRAPKGKKFTAEQEEKLARSERLAIRADILTAGVAATLKEGAYCGSELLTEAATVLIEASDYRARSYKMRDEATKGDDAAFVNTVRGGVARVPPGVRRRVKR